MSGDYPPPFVEPAYRWLPPGRLGTYGPEIVDWCAHIGHPVDAEQAAAIDAFASYGPGGLWHAFEVCMVEGRQNGKTDRTILPLTLADFFLLGAEGITWTAHVMDTCLETFRKVQQLIDGSDELTARVANITESKSEQAITLTTGAVWEFRARAGGGGRGKTRDIWVADEALILPAQQMGARMPSLSARPNPQIRYASSAGMADSAQLQDLVKRGRAGSDDSLIYVEYCAPGGWADPGCEDENCSHVYGAVQGCVFDRRELWHRASHALGRRISYAFVAKERKTLPVLEFGRERMGWHELPADSTARPIDPEDWKAVAVERSRPVGVPAVVLDVAPRQMSAVIAVAVVGRDGVPHVELADERPGTDWVADRLLAILERDPDAVVGYDEGGPVGALVPDLEAAGIKLEGLSGREMGRACAHLEGLARDRALTRWPDPRLDVAFHGAVPKPIGDGLWLWGRRKSETNISRAVALTGALWLAEVHHDDGSDIAGTFY